MAFQKKYNTYLLAILAICFAGCKAGGNFPGMEYMPDMAHSKAVETYTPSPTVDNEVLFANGMSARLPVKGSIPRGYMPYHLKDTAEDYELAGSSVRNPFHDDREAVLKNGKKNFEIYCAVCHGKGGAGNGSLTSLGSGPYPPPPSYFKEGYLDMSEGKMFHSVHHGKNLMGSYASQLTQNERWEVITYIKSLQAKEAKSSQKLGSDEEALAYVLRTSAVSGGYVAPAEDEPESFLDALMSQKLEKGSTITLKNVFFNSGSFQLKPESFVELGKLVSILKNNPASKVEISGHTDSQGDANANLELSKNRAQAVMTYLVTNGVPKAALTSMGYGASVPVADNETEEGRARNRRTEFKVVE